jgi:hypothetical protein
MDCDRRRAWHAHIQRQASIIQIAVSAAPGPGLSASSQASRATTSAHSFAPSATMPKSFSSNTKVAMDERRLLERARGVAPASHPREGDTRANSTSPIPTRRRFEKFLSFSDFAWCRVEYPALAQSESLVSRARVGLGGVAGGGLTHGADSCTFCLRPRFSSGLRRQSQTTPGLRAQAPPGLASTKSLRSYPLAERDSLLRRVRARRSRVCLRLRSHSIQPGLCNATGAGCSATVGGVALRARPHHRERSRPEGA